MLSSMRTVAVANRKGGTSKTTTVVSFAAILGELGHRVLVVDVDPQGSATDWLATRPADVELADVFRGEASIVDAIQPSTAEGVDLVPGGLGVELAIQDEPGRETLLRIALEAVPADAYAFVLLDSPPALGILSVSALVAADEVLVPVTPDPMSLSGLAALLQIVESVRRRLNPTVRVGSILVCRADRRRSLTAEVVARLQSRFPDLVLDTVIGERARIAEAPSHRQPITTYDPASASEYRAAVAEYLARLEQEQKHGEG